MPGNYSVLIHFLAPHGKLYKELLALEQMLGSIPPIIIAQRNPGSTKPRYGIPPEEWPTILHRVIENQEPLRTIAGDDGVSYETVRRIIRTARVRRTG